MVVSLPLTVRARLRLSAAFLSRVFSLADLSKALTWDEAENEKY